MSNGWRRATKDRPCSVCGRPNSKHTSTWCIVSNDGDAVICPFTSNGAKRYIENSGYLHIFKQNDSKVWTNGKHIPKRNYKPLPRRVVKWAVLQDFYTNRVIVKDVIILAKEIDVKPDSLRMLGIGYEGNGTWTFPMRDDTGKIIGIRKRNCTGKTAVYGSRNGLFMCDHLSPERKTVIVCEGPTDTAKALDLGYPAIGRASCNTCETMIERLLNGRFAVVIADNDETGIHYANKLAKRINAKVVLPARGKDLREWNPNKAEFEKLLQ